MNSVELMDKKNQLRIQAEAILSGAEKEQRKLNDEEANQFQSLKKQMDEVENEIRELNKKLSNQTSEKRMEKFSLLKAINDIANNRQLDERSQDVVNQGVAEMRKAGLSYSGQIVLPIETRDIQATVATNGQEVVAEDKLNILEPLKANLVLSAAGATYMTGLVGNINIPSYSGSNVGWAGEIEGASNGQGTFGEINLEPKRITAYIDISKQFLIQDSVSAEALLRNDIVKAISHKLEETILGDGDGKKGGAGADKDNVISPKGIFNGATTIADTTYETMVGLEQLLEEANVSGDFKFIASPAIKAQLKTTKKDSGSGLFVMENGEVDGIPVLTTSACKGIVLGNFNDYVIGQWGSIDLTIDPYSQATNGKVRLVVNAYFDAKPRRSEAFVAKTIANKG